MQVAVRVMAAFLGAALGSQYALDKFVEAVFLVRGFYCPVVRPLMARSWVVWDVYIYPV